MNTEFLCSSQYLMQEQGETQIVCLPPGVQKAKTIELLFVLIVSVQDDLELDKQIFWAPLYTKKRIQISNRLLLQLNLCIDKNVCMFCC